jgi:hypothetical protein
MMRTPTIPCAFAGACAFWLTACGGGPAPASSPQVAKASPSVTVAPAAKPALAQRAPSAPKPASPFNVIGELPADLSLFGVGERGFLISQAGVELQLVGDEVVQDPLLKRGLPVPPTIMLSVDGVGGRYPDAFWLSTSEPRGRTGFSALWRWDGKNWQRNASMADTHYITGILPWVGGRMLALEQSGMAFDASFVVLSGDKRVALPQFTKAKFQQEFGYCKTRLKPEQWATLPTGEVFAVGQHCDPERDYQELAVERWAPGAKTSTIDILPGIHAEDDPPIRSYEATGIAVISPNDVFVAALKRTWRKDTPTKTTPYFAQFDGKTWQALPSPIPGGVRSLWTEPGGVIFASNDKGELWSRGANGKWSPIIWPSALTEQGELKLVGFWPRAAGDDWAVVEVVSPQKGWMGCYLLHTRPAVNGMPTLEAMSRKERSLRLPGPPVDWCETRFVLLYTLARKAPADYDYPATRKALKGHNELAVDGLRFVEFEREGRRYFGARVPDFDVGEKLAKLVKDKVPGSTPELVCLDPLENRTLDIDLKTGELRK